MRKTLIVLGLVWVFRRRTREKTFFALSGLAYFLGCLGFLGFSRLRDLSTLALFITHGAIYLALKTTMQVRERAQSVAMSVGPIAVVWLVACCKGSSVIDDENVVKHLAFAQFPLPPGGGKCAMPRCWRRAGTPTAPCPWRGRDRRGTG